MSRPVLKAVRPTQANIFLTGLENLKYVEPNRIYHYGYKMFLDKNKIRELFGERIANSKKIRKAKIRDILKNTMHTLDMTEFPDTAVVDDFLVATETRLREHIAEIQAMSSSPIGTEINTVATKRKKESVEKPKRRSPEKVVVVNPIENQVDFLTQMMETITAANPPNFTKRQLEAKFRKAKEADEEAVNKKLLEQELQKKAEKRRKVTELNREIREDLTDLFRDTGL